MHYHTSVHSTHDNHMTVLYLQFGRMSDELGRGQFGVVYRGELCLSDDEDPLEVAVKTLEDGRDEEERVKFLQEAAIMGQFVRHPNILRILGIVYDKRVSTVVLCYVLVA